MTTTRVRSAHRMFEMEHVHRDLRRRSVRGAAATLFSQAGLFCIQLAGMAVLARLLLPADFGVFGKTVALTGFITVLRTGGLSLATVQRAEITHAQVSTLFWLNVALGVGAAALLCGLSPLMAWFYRDPRVLWLAMALSISIVVDSLSIQHQALMQRQMRFGTMGSVTVAARIIGFLVAFYSAWLGAGYWALVVQQFGTSMAMLVLTVWNCRWLPDLPRRGSGVRPMVALGANQSGFNVLNFANRNMDNILIGRFVSDVALGFYTQAYRLLLLPVQQINAPITAVMVPGLSRLQDQPERFARFYYRALGMVTFLGMPVVCFLMADARQVIEIVLGPKWLPVVGMFEALGLAAFFGTFNIANGWVYSSLGHTARQLRQQLVTTPITVLGFFIGLPWGALGVATSFSVTRALLALPQLYYCYIGTPVNMRTTLTTLARPAVASIAAGVVLWLVHTLATSERALVQVVLDAALYGALYMGIYLVMPHGRVHLTELAGLLRELKSSNKKEETRESTTSHADRSMGKDGVPNQEQQPK